MRPTVYAVAALVLCCVCQYTMYQFVEEIRTNSLIPSMEAVSNLASNNAYLNDRIEWARKAVAVVNTENTQLKASLKEGIKMLQEEIEENNKLADENNNLRWQIDLLEQTIELLKEPEEEEMEVTNG